MFYVDGHAFFVTKSSKVNFITAQYCVKRSKGQIINALDEAIHKYSARGFNVTAIHGDNKFNIKELKNHFAPYRGNTLDPLKELLEQLKNEQDAVAMQCHITITQK